MIDDLITKNIFEPYRMMTSRSEYRLLLRQDNAPFRLSEKAFNIGLINSEFIETVRSHKKQVEHYLTTWKKTITPEHFVKKFNLKHKIPLVNLFVAQVGINHLIEEGQFQFKNNDKQNKL